MTKHYKQTLAAFALLLSALPFAAYAQIAPNFVRPRSPNEVAIQPAPKVVFIGDWITYYWASVFLSNPSWINQGVSGVHLRFRGEHRVQCLPDSSPMW